ncbi:hypothetical protein [Microvirga splendida]|uniref:Uncharacterized protein n=1 Tax=Microvirga splendida TaxID=2795727 RepID=A0ABS0Y3K6_9HYPH|nr:hypothetical protein [Microvirga splendida]MBJ6126615.1 hypothetical protein [Microvirga splendida]
MTKTDRPRRSIIARLNDSSNRDAQFEASIEAINVLLGAIQRLEREIVELRKAVPPHKTGVAVGKTVAGDMS